MHSRMGCATKTDTRQTDTSQTDTRQTESTRPYSLPHDRLGAPVEDGDATTHEHSCVEALPCALNAIKGELRLGQNLTPTAIRDANGLDAVAASRIPIPSHAWRAYHARTPVAYAGGPVCRRTASSDPRRHFPVPVVVIRYTGARRWWGLNQAVWPLYWTVLIDSARSGERVARAETPRARKLLAQGLARTSRDDARCRVTLGSVMGSFMAEPLRACDPRAADVGHPPLLHAPDYLYGRGLARRGFVKL